MGGGLGAVKSSYDLIGYFRAGGVFMWPILIILFVAITFAIERLIVFMTQKNKLSPIAFLENLDALIEEKRPKLEITRELIELCETKKGVAAGVFMAGLQKYIDALNMNMSVAETKRWMIEGIENRAKTELPILDAHINVLGICFTVAPLLGLLGTVAGMIASFKVMAQSGGGAKPDELAGGIAQALLTTAFGLIVAIPTMIVHAYVRSKADSYVNEIEEAAIEMVDVLAKSETEGN